jgi:TPR repeat protein
LEAFKCYTNAVAQGRSDCLNSLGLIYEQGYAGEGDPQKAVQCYRESAAKGSGLAMVNLGRMYQDGLGAEKDPVEAYKWFTLAARSGTIVARHYLEQLDGSSPLSKDKLTPEQMDEAVRRVNSYHQ